MHSTFILLVKFSPIFKTFQLLDIHFQIHNMKSKSVNQDLQATLFNNLPSIIHRGKNSKVTFDMIGS